MARAVWSPKDPQDVRDYWVDFAPLGLAAGETVTVATVAVPDDQAAPVAPFELLAVGAPAPVGQKVVARFTGGSPGKYVIDYHVTTNTGQEFDLEKTLTVKERIVT